jgi:UDP-N-acetylglucosamine--N-acetylmuramyl-(pentapeptide) pyrophosphoryl-undecaprenol N-acetylglucosamine transferase
MSSDTLPIPSDATTPEPSLLSRFMQRYGRMPHVVLTGGGTGGHLYPALAVAEALLNVYGLPRENLHYIGNENSLEAAKVPKRSIYFYPILCSGMPRGKNPIPLLKWMGELGAATFRAGRILKTIRADVILGTGGYVAAPVLMAARGLKIPYMVHESDAIPGLLNRQMAPGAACVTAAFAQANQWLKAPETRFHHTGNPIDPAIATLNRHDALARLKHQGTLPPTWNEARPTLLVLGGSQGAQRLNEAVLDALPVLIQDIGWNVIHQCGPKNQAAVKRVLNNRWGSDDPYPNSYKSLPFIEDMPACWALAEQAVCRAGSMSLAEMLASRTPSILVPYPYAAQNHQEANARTLVEAEAALMLKDAELTGPSLLVALEDLGRQHTRIYDQMYTLARPQATYTITEQLLRLLPL